MHVPGRRALAVPAMVPSSDFLRFLALRGIDDGRCSVPFFFGMASALCVLERARCSGNPRRRRAVGWSGWALLAQTAARYRHRGCKTRPYGRLIPGTAIPDECDRIAIARDA